MTPRVGGSRCEGSIAGVTQLIDSGKRSTRMAQYHAIGQDLARAGYGPLVTIRMGMVGSTVGTKQIGRSSLSHRTAGHGKRRTVRFPMGKNSTTSAGIRHVFGQVIWSQSHVVKTSCVGLAQPSRLLGEWLSLIAHKVIRTAVRISTSIGVSASAAPAGRCGSVAGMIAGLVDE